MDPSKLKHCVAVNNSEGERVGDVYQYENFAVVEFRLDDGRILQTLIGKDAAMVVRNFRGKERQDLAVIPPRVITLTASEPAQQQPITVNAVFPPLETIIERDQFGEIVRSIQRPLPADAVT